ncbi:cobyrinate a,c-diamide synthase [Rhodocyclus gracilis]|uniref:Cobyrinate a,c-diamide synthase n=1 Tax=Rhodocyclus tenuis TaxID=1066 RepID=A0A6L5JVM4_RHOTE|nr:cobyrinate a,c-diamide synthase [Rhodocyclus gracilis]MQY51413.1 cobyrinate a,c-diamide synthase [Rhodocyclus gracilis]
MPESHSAPAGPRRCPALFITAPASGQGKTTVVAALARLHTRLGRRVRVFKCGPDFLDPQIHRVATGHDCYNIDLWMCGEADGAARLAAAAAEADLILVEGVMGLYDGEPSGADIAARFGLPILAVINGASVSTTFGAIAYGLKHYRPGTKLVGALANRVAGERHAELLRAGLPDDIAWVGALPRDADGALPERHLGLLPAAEIAGLNERLDHLADLLAATGAATLPAPVDFPHPAATAPTAGATPLAGRRIAVARDAAFCFLYPANLDCLRALGATLTFFSPLAGEPLPECDAVWLPGGYPELHGERLAAQCALWSTLAAHVAADKPLLAECGGMMTLFAGITDNEGRRHAMAGLLPGEILMQRRLAALGMCAAGLPAAGQTTAGEATADDELRGHSFHYSRAETPLAPFTRAVRADGRPGEAIYRQRRLTASYMHFYFPSNPRAAAQLFLP